MEKIEEIEKEVQKLREEVNELQRIVATLIALLRKYELEYALPTWVESAAAKWAERYWRWAVEHQEAI